MKTILTTVFSAGFLLAQTPSVPTFEVASIRPSQPDNIEKIAIGVHVDGAQVRILSLPLKDYIARAYRVKLFQVTGPDWIGSNKYDLNAKLPAGSTPDQLPEMLQSLLIERFGLKLHREKKDLPVYALLVGKPPLKIHESAAGGAEAPAAAKGTVNADAQAGAAGVSVSLGNGSYYTFANGKFIAAKITMDMLARQLERYLDRPVVDMTGLKGNYDVTLNVNPEDAQTMMIRAAMNTGISLPPQALRLAEGGSIASLLDSFEQLGLKLEARKAPLDVVVIDQASKTPTEN